ncbi:MAG TPA: hypothetical protein HA256_03675 [Methanoregulaceae archaeon]|jgi:hypothetical protein|nr:hypothetical protein [Methanoregulaceae archaeon]
MKNHEWKWVYVAAGGAVVFFLLIGIADQSMDCMSGGCAVMFVSFFLAVTLVAVALLFWSRARTMDAILSGKELLAHWTYSDEDSVTSAEREFAEYREANKALFIIVGGFFLIAIIFLLIFGGEAGVLTTFILLGAVGIIALVAWGAPRLVYASSLKRSPEACIAGNGIIYREAVYPFRSFLNRLDGVSFREAAQGEPSLLIFSFIQVVGLYILRPYEVRVPVPGGEEERAREIARKLG